MGKAQRQKHRIKTIGREWTAWAEIPVTDEMRASSPHMQHVSRVFANSRYEVQIFDCATTAGGVAQVVIARHGHVEMVDWNECQRIKNELFGAEHLAVEIYPREVAPAMKVRILWVLPLGMNLPYGLDCPGAWGEPV